MAPPLGGPALGLPFVQPLAGGGGSASPFPHFAAAKKVTQQGGRNTRVLVIGDSTAAGQGSTNNGQNSNCFSEGWPVQLASLLQTATGIPCSWQSRFACGNFTSLESSDTRCTKTGLFTNLAANGTSVGGPMVKSTGAGTYSFTPTTAVDTFVIRYPSNTGLGSGTVNIDGGATLATITNNAAQAMHSVTVTAASAGDHTLNLVTSANNFYWSSLYAYNSAIPEISIFNAGWCASLATNWDDSTSAWSPIHEIPNLQPDLVIFCETINDWNAGTATATYTTQMQAVINAIPATCDILLATGISSNPATEASMAQQLVYTNIVNGLATTNGLHAPVNLSNTLGGSWAAANASGFMFDDLHAKQSGYAQNAIAFSALLAL